MEKLNIYFFHLKTLDFMNFGNGLKQLDMKRIIEKNSMINNKQIKNIQKILQYKFKNLDNLKSSLNHPSIFKNNRKIQNKIYL